MVRKRQFAIILVLVFLVSISLASATVNDLVITHTGDGKVAPGAIATFKVSIFNSGNDRLVLDIGKDPFSTLSSSWYEYISIEPNRIELNGIETKEVEVNVKFKRTVPTDASYSTFITFVPIGKQNGVEYPFIMRVVPPEELLDIEFDVPERVKPGKELEVAVTLKNKLNILLSELEVYAASEIFEETKALKLLPLQEREEIFKIKIPEGAKPASYTMNLRVYFDKQLAAKKSVDFTISTVSDISTKEDTGKGFLKWWVTVTKSNVGNKAADDTYALPLTTFQRMFASYEPEPTTGVSGAQWDFTVNPNSEYVIKAVVNYRSLFWVIIVLASFAIFTYLVLARGVTIKKEVLMLHTNHEGMSELRIKLHIHNRSTKPLKDSALIEVLPHHIHPKMHFSTLQPDKIEKGESGIRLLWSIPEIAKHEERLVSYTIETKMGVLGKIVLPPSMLRYKTVSGKITSIRSNRLEFISGPEEYSKKH